MLFFRSFNRSILIGLVLYGLSTVTVNAALIDLGDVTRDDETGLDWLDLTITTSRSYNDVSDKFGPGKEFEGWRYASTAEIELFFTHAGGTAPFGPTPIDGYQGNDAGNDPDGWIFKLLDLWGVTTSTGSPFHPGAEALSGTSHEIIDPNTGRHVNVWGAALVIDFAYPPPNQNPDRDFALIATTGAYTTSYNRDTTRSRLGSALVRTYVPIPAAVWLFGTALIGLIGFGKRKARITD